MEYTNLILFGLGLFGIVIHNLVKINDINRRNDGNFRFRPFIRLEWPSIAISLCVVIVSLIVRNEVKQLSAVGPYIGLAFVAIGYMAQSLVYHLMGKAEKRINGQ